MVQALTAGTLSKDDPLFAPYLSAKAETDKLEAELAELDNATGFFAKTKAKAQQVMVNGKLTTAKANLSSVETTIGLDALKSNRVAELACPQTQSILDKIEVAQKDQAQQEEAVTAAQKAIDECKPKWCERTGLAAIQSVDEVGAEADRLKDAQLNLVAETLDQLITGARTGTLPSDFPMSEQIQKPYKQLFTL